MSSGHFLSHFYPLSVPPLFPMLRRSFDLDAVGLGLVMSVVAVGRFLQVPAGALVERVGTKRVFVLGVAVTGGGIAAAGLAGPYPLLLAAALVFGAGQAGFHPVDYTLLAASSTGVGISFGVVFTAAVASFLSPALLGGVIERVGTGAAFALVALFFLAAAVVLRLKLGLVGERPLFGTGSENGDEADRRRLIGISKEPHTIRL